MNYVQANQILDKARDGKLYPAHILDLALELTGDLNEARLHAGLIEPQANLQTLRLEAWTQHEFK